MKPPTARTKNDTNVYENQNKQRALESLQLQGNDVQKLLKVWKRTFYQNIIQVHAWVQKGAATKIQFTVTN